MAGGSISRGTHLAIGIILLWVGGGLLFVAFMSGKVDSLTIGKDQKGKPQGPRNVSEAIGRIAENVQAAEQGHTLPSSDAVMQV